MSKALRGADSRDLGIVGDAIVVDNIGTADLNINRVGVGVILRWSPWTKHRFVDAIDIRKEAREYGSWDNLVIDIHSDNIVVFIASEKEGLRGCLSLVDVSRVGEDSWFPSEGKDLVDFLAKRI